jgi:predicted RNase H-like nuclease
MTRVAGADVAKGRWVVVVLEGGRFKQAFIEKTIADVLGAVEDLSVLAVDIPIGLPRGGAHRRCDVEAKALLKAKASSVFFAPPRRVIEAPSYEQANLLSKTGYGRGISRQAYGLRAKILEVSPVAARDDRIIEVHPEVSFLTMKNGPLEFSKKTWNGQMERRSLLQAQGIEIPNQLDPAGSVPPDDLLDAAAAAWTAWRADRGKADVLPSSNTGRPRNTRQMIWR